jgi:hypothetical protein
VRQCFEVGPWSNFKNLQGGLETKNKRFIGGHAGCILFSVPNLANHVKSAYIARMLSRVRNSRGRPLNTPAAFIHPCQPIVAKQPPSGPGWAHELKHDGYWLQMFLTDIVLHGCRLI